MGAKHNLQRHNHGDSDIVALTARVAALEAAAGGLRVVDLGVVEATDLLAGPVVVYEVTPGEEIIVDLRVGEFTMPDTSYLLVHMGGSDKPYTTLANDGDRRRHRVGQRHDVDRLRRGAHHRQRPRLRAGWERVTLPPSRRVLAARARRSHAAPNKREVRVGRQLPAPSSGVRYRAPSGSVATFVGRQRLVRPLFLPLGAVAPAGYAY